MKKKLVLPLFAFLIFCYSLFLGFYRPLENNTPPVGSTAQLRSFYDYKGVTHVHTRNSSGSGSISEIVQQAKLAGLHFFYITDLNPFNLPQVQEGYIDNVAILAAGEYSYLDSKILIYHNTTTEHVQNAGQFHLRLKSLLEQENRGEEFGNFVLAHPFKKNYKWGGPYPNGLDGIEVINLKSLWQRWWHKSKSSFLWSALIYPFNPRLALLRMMESPKKNLELWDQLNQSKLVVGFSGSDAEALTHILNKYPVAIPKYETVFRVTSNHLLLSSELTGHFKSDKNKINQAIRKGQFYISIDLLANPVGFEAYLENGTKKLLAMGNQYYRAQAGSLVVNLPANIATDTKIHLIKDGKIIQTSRDNTLNAKNLKKGSYRIIVRLKVPFPFPDKSRWMDWIYTNPFRVQ